MIFLSAQAQAKDPGLSAFYKGNFEAAGEYYQKRLEKDPDNPKILFNYGTSALGQNDLESANAFLRRSLTSENSKQRAVAHYNLGQAALKNRDIRAALEHFKKSLIYDPEDKDSKVMFEQLLSMMKEQQEQQQEQKDRENDNNSDQDESAQNNDAEQNKDEENEQPAGQDQNASSDEGKDQEQQQTAASDLTEEDLTAEELSREQAENILNAMREKEMESMKKLILSKSNLKRTKRSKEW